MVTDNWPVDVKYCSRRLVRQIVQQDAAPRRKWLKGIGISAGVAPAGISADLGPSEADHGNLYDLVRRATAAVSDNTGTLASPGEYVRTTLDVTWGAIPVHMGWERAQNVRVASFFANAEVAGVGGVFLGLFGSATNFLGIAQDEYRGGWMPSEVEGLYQILDDTSEPGDPEVSTEFIHWDQDLDSESRIHSAVTLYQTASAHGGGAVELLFKPYLTAHDVDLSFHGLRSHDKSGRYGLVMLGAPIWVSTPLPGADRTALPFAP
ncbi:hypothetical protein [Kribbella sp. NPDC000426]|uniref:DUF7019 family protein n=1 Tax=Kribbella sp. NPDC000426 TaxID=3154255 RepID=UPI0033223BC1